MTRSPNSKIQRNAPAVRAESLDSTDGIPDHTEAEWVEIITADLGRAVESIIAAGTHLRQAKHQLPHGSFGPMCERLGLSDRTAQRLMAIAEDERLTKPTHVSLLPPSWGTLYLLTRLDDPTFNRLIEDGTIRPDMERKDIEQFKRNRSANPNRQMPPQPKLEAWAQPDSGKPPVEAMEAKAKANAEAEAKALAAK